MNALFAAATEIQQFLDWPLISEELEPLAAVRDVPGLLDRLRDLRNNAG